jgi:hypothetical protein
MKIMVMREDRFDDIVVPTQQPLEGAYQDTYVKIERHSVEPTVTHVVQKEIEHNGEKYFHTTRSEVTNPKVEEWLEIGHDHEFNELHQHGQLWVHMSRKVIKTGWFIDLDTLEDLAALLIEDKIQSNIYVRRDFHLEDETMLVVVAS